jgi:uncharacterized protein (DUF2147 family)
MKKTVFAALLGLASSFAFAQMSPVGLWRTIDDETKTEKSLVRITETGGVMTGKVEKIADPAKANANCDKCTDERKDKPVLGMTILRGVKPSSDAGTWEGGDILDPNNGKIYKVRLKPIDGGKQMEVRGFIGVSLLGRTQTWVRVE